MPDSRAFSNSSDQFQPLHTLVSVSPLGPGAVGATPGVLDFGRQVRETLGLDGLRPDVQVEVVHTVDHHLG